MLGSEQLTAGVRIATAVVPIGMYFLILGLLNTRRRPQLLTGRRDFILLIAALGPLFILPVLVYFAAPPGPVLLGVAVLCAGIWALAPRGRTWVIYNISEAEAGRSVERALTTLRLEFRRRENGFDLVHRGATLQIGSFTLLRNVSLRLRGGGDRLARQFERELSRAISDVRVEAGPMAVAMLLVAAAMLVVPLTLVAHRAGEIVRLLTDLLP